MFDCVSKQWTVRENIGPVINRTNLSAVLVGNGRVLLLGGYTHVPVDTSQGRRLGAFTRKNASPLLLDLGLRAAGVLYFVFFF